jgi:hypothetical protein
MHAIFADVGFLSPEGPKWIRIKISIKPQQSLKPQLETKNLIFEMGQKNES